MGGFHFIPVFRAPIHPFASARTLRQGGRAYFPSVLVFSLPFPVFPIRFRIFPAVFVFSHPFPVCAASQPSSVYPNGVGLDRSYRPCGTTLRSVFLCFFVPRSLPGNHVSRRGLPIIDRRGHAPCRTIFWCPSATTFRPSRASGIVARACVRVLVRTRAKLRVPGH